MVFLRKHHTLVLLMLTRYFDASLSLCCEYSDSPDSNRTTEASSFRIIAEAAFLTVTQPQRQAFKLHRAHVTRSLASFCLDSLII